MMKGVQLTTFSADFEDPPDEEGMKWSHRRSDYLVAEKVNSSRKLIVIKYPLRGRLKYQISAIARKLREGVRRHRRNVENSLKVQATLVLGPIYEQQKISYDAVRAIEERIRQNQTHQLTPQEEYSWKRWYESDRLFRALVHAKMHAHCSVEAYGRAHLEIQECYGKVIKYKTEIERTASERISKYRRRKKLSAILLELSCVPIELNTHLDLCVSTSRKLSVSLRKYEVLKKAFFHDFHERA
ncbi:uncharacterized protein LOC100900735 [Galendromus occidentalis]|uniref:Uncharacterized protein LOC100900735 n=1 Tax=Galendromus occidentalis TaxID=34638 RepID=A0AAJ6VY33_9ACAR|nr:uncharacterized protein LOC100900735 [Galendromus occidentalis]